MIEFRFKSHWNLFPNVQLTISQHWFRWWLGAEQATSHYVNQWRPSSRTHICGTGGRWVKSWKSSASSFDGFLYSDIAIVNSVGQFKIMVKHVFLSVVLRPYRYIFSRDFDSGCGFRSRDGFDILRVWLTLCTFEKGISRCFSDLHPGANWCRLRLPYIYAWRSALRSFPVVPSCLNPSSTNQSTVHRKHSP